MMSFLIQFIKSGISRFKRDYSRNLFNKTTNSKIESDEASLSSLKGDNITVLRGCYISGDSEINANTFIGFNVLISKSTIGRYCSIASNVNIGHGEHPTDYISTSLVFTESAYDLLTQKPCVIGNDVWIGVGATIRRGITVGDGAIIGANAFVNKDVPPFAIVAGVPAKIIRYRFDDDKINKIRQSQWWLKSFDEAKLIINELDKND